MELCEHPDFPQAILAVAEHFRGQGCFTEIRPLLWAGLLRACS